MSLEHLDIQCVSVVQTSPQRWSLRIVAALSFVLLSCRASSVPPQGPEARNPSPPLVGDSELPAQVKPPLDSRNLLESRISMEKAIGRAQSYMLAVSGDESLPGELAGPTCRSQCVHMTAKVIADTCHEWVCEFSYGERVPFRLEGTVPVLVYVHDSGRLVWDELGIDRCYRKPHRCRLTVGSEGARRTTRAPRTAVPDLTWSEDDGEFFWLIPRAGESHASGSEAEDARARVYRVNAHSE